MSDVRIELAIGGMTCAACAARIERKLSKLDEVTAAVNLATERATVTAPAWLPVADLIGAIEAAGYSATVVGGADDAPDDAAAGARYLWRRLVVALVFFVPLSDLSLILSLDPALRFPGWQWVLIVLAAPAVGWAAWPFHRAALMNARHGGVSMDTLVSLGIIASTGWSVYAMFVLDRVRGAPLPELVHGAGGGIYLEVAATVTTFLLGGRFYEARARRIAGQAMRELAAAGARDAYLLSPDGSEERVPVGRLAPGDMIVVRPGEKIAADGTVLFGESAVDTSTMTGESVPADVAEGDQVTGGTIALTGRLVVRADRVGPDTQLAQLIGLVERAQADKAAVQRLADRVCGVFVPAVLVLAVVTLGGWLLAGRPAGFAFSAGLAVLIIACPCALGLATPAALVVACGRGARLGIFIKGCEALEASRSVDTVVLDKTGTVTTGRMTLREITTVPEVDEQQVLGLAAAVERASEHPVAAAITAAAADAVPAGLADGFRALPGLGARGVVDGVEVIVGRERLLSDQGLEVPPELGQRRTAWEEAGCTVVLVGWDGRARGAIAVADTIRPSAPGAVAELRRLGLRPVLLTGDSQATARAVAAAAGIDEVIAEVHPAGKAAYITGLRDAGHRVAMVGDGVNDGPALAAATLGLAVGSGTDVAITAADLILLRDDLGVVPDAIRLARATFTTIRRNLGWAFCYNLAAIPLAAAGLLNPLIAAATMTLSSTFVVGNSLRLRRFRAGAVVEGDG
ncbi:MAG TPA: cation-translocating P-type ATPase [Streptosporangiaceae bacterium]|nr:cation-translocating P-type ATPase [Streptosporangiaceae bacterium]